MNSLERMIRDQIEAHGVHAPAVLEAMRRVPREMFVPKEIRSEAYADGALPIGLGQTISQPLMVAIMTEALEPEGAQSVLEIGTGSGYQTAILAELFERVYTIERIPELLIRARETLGALEIGNVQYKAGDGTLGWPEHAPFDRILIAAAAPDVPRKLLLGQLAEDGIAVLPVAREAEDWQALLRIRTRDGELLYEDLGGCRFVPLVGVEGYPGGSA